MAKSKKGLIFILQFSIKTFVFTEPVMMMNISAMAPINNLINRGIKNSEYVKKPISQVIEKKTNEKLLFKAK